MPSVVRQAGGGPDERAHRRLDSLERRVRENRVAAREAHLRLDEIAIPPVAGGSEKPARRWWRRRPSDP